MNSTPYDVAIVGAGPAGIAAAIGVARAGETAILIERDESIGGNATQAMVGTLCGLSRCGAQAPRPPRIEIPGFAGEFSRRVAAESESYISSNDQGLVYLPYRVDAFSSVVQTYLREHRTISIHTSTTLKSIERSAHDFTLHLTSMGHLSHTVVARALIDTTGDSAAIRRLDSNTQAPQFPQAAALVFGLSGLPEMGEGALGFLMRKRLREGNLDGLLHERQTYLSFVPGSLRGKSALCKLGTQPPSPETPAETIYEMALKDIATIVSFLSTTPELYDVRLTHTAPRLGIRSGQRGVGIDTLSDNAIHAGARHSKGIALGLWPAEMWNTPIRPEMTFIGGAGSYEIPLGSLCAGGIPGVYFAGRTLSATDLAIASARVIGTCLATGFAAGQLAARTVRGDDEESIVHDLRSEQVEPFYHLTTV